ncbi:cupin domain-containing protein [Nocardia sp. 2YAB30]|uniref:cupin domain-containing protein n=1 Tax=unclassified Nocardia TaxID=2637762 RepID=UPI003F9711B1
MAEVGGQGLSAVSRTAVLDVVLARTKPTARVEVRRIEMPAGTAAGLHVHNCPVFGSIVAGSVAYRIEGESERVLGPGDVFYEPEGQRIARFDALDEDVVFLGYFLLDTGQEPGIEFPHD